MRWVMGMILSLNLLGTGVGCAAYKVTALQPLQPEFHASAQSVEGISACYEVLDAAASKRYFNKDLRKVGYQPVQFTVVNGPARYLKFALSQVSLQSSEAASVAEQCHFNTAGRATGYGVAGVFIWPLIIPAIVDGVGSSKANTQMDHDFAAKVLKDQIIMPYGMVNGVVFVPSEATVTDVSLRLFDKGSSDVFVFRWSNSSPVAAARDSLRLEIQPSIANTEHGESCETQTDTTGAVMISGDSGQ